MDLINQIFTFDKILQVGELAQYQKYVQNLNICKPSFVFHRDEQQFKHNEEIRKSKVIHVEDEGLLNFVKSGLLKTVSQKSGMNIKLARKRVTFIKYDEGGFFDWHNDHEKYVINGRSRHLEMHLLFCIAGTQEGGELLIKEIKKPNISTSEASSSDSKDPVKITKIKQACTTNGCVLFDKHLEHAGGKVLKGNKLIMTVDVMVSTHMVAKDPKLSLRMESLVKKLAAGKISNIGTYQADELKKIWGIIPEAKRKGLVPFVEVTYSGEITQLSGPKVAKETHSSFYRNDSKIYLYDEEKDQSLIHLKKIGKEGQKHL